MYVGYLSTAILKFITLAVLPMSFLHLSQRRLLSETSRQLPLMLTRLNLSVPALVASDLVVGVDTGAGARYSRRVEVGTARARQVEVLAATVIRAARVAKKRTCQTTPHRTRDI